jgi:hypothetical protein
MYLGCLIRKVDIPLVPRNLRLEMPESHHRDNFGALDVLQDDFGVNYFLVVFECRAVRNSGVDIYLYHFTKFL